MRNAAESNNVEYNDVAMDRAATTATKSKRKKDKQQMLCTWYEYNKLLNLANILHRATQIYIHGATAILTNRITVCYFVIFLLFFLLLLGFFIYFSQSYFWDRAVYCNAHWRLNVNHSQPQKDKPLCTNLG